MDHNKWLESLLPREGLIVGSRKRRNYEALSEFGITSLYRKFVHMDLMETEEDIMHIRGELYRTRFQDKQFKVVIVDTGVPIDCNYNTRRGVNFKDAINNLKRIASHMVIVVEALEPNRTYTKQLAIYQQPCDYQYWIMQPLTVQNYVDETVRSSTVSWLLQEWGEKPEAYYTRLQSIFDRCIVEKIGLDFSTVIDLSCGEAGYTMQLPKWAERVIGVTIHSSSVCEAYQRAALCYTGDNIQFTNPEKFTDIGDKATLLLLMNKAHYPRFELFEPELLANPSKYLARNAHVVLWNNDSEWINRATIAATRTFKIVYDGTACGGALTVCKYL